MAERAGGGKPSACALLSFGTQCRARGPAEPEAPSEGDAGCGRSGVALASRFGLRRTRPLDSWRGA